MSRKLDGYQGNRYEHNGIQNEYTLVSGQFALPLATDSEDDDPVVFVQAFKDYRIRRVLTTAIKEGGPPLIPSPEDKDVYGFVGGVTTIPYPVLTPSGSFKWTVATEFAYVENCSSTLPEKGYVLGSPPFVYSQQAENANLGFNAQNAPASVAGAGIGPKVGYSLSLQLNTDSANWEYLEPSYFPPALQSNDLVSGPSDYPQLGSA